MRKTSGDGPARTTTGHRYGVRAALDARVPVGWGKVKEPSPQDIADYNARQQTRRATKAELARVLKTFPQLKPLVDTLRSALSDEEILEWDAFKDQRRELERRRKAALGKRV